MISMIKFNGHGDMIRQYYVESPCTLLCLVLQATSAQDSGIGGTAEDHRSSQDLGEYDEDETDRLMNSSSNTSINSATSSNHSPLSR